MSIAAVPAERTPELVLRLHPSVAYLDSPWPIADIWRANQPDRDSGPVDLAAGGVHLEVRRHRDDVEFRALSASTFAFRRALARGATLAEAAGQALEAQGDFPLARAVRDLLEEGIAVDCRFTPTQTEV